MRIKEALKKKLIDRVSHNDRWLYWDDVDNEWVVNERKYRQKFTRPIIRTEDEEKAVNCLIESEVIDE